MSSQIWKESYIRFILLMISKNAFLGSNAAALMQMMATLGWLDKNFHQSSVGQSISILNTKDVETSNTFHLLFLEIATTSAKKFFLLKGHAMLNAQINNKAMLCIFLL